MTCRIIPCEQGSPEWHQARLGLVTASELHTVLADGKKGNPALTRRKYMLQLIGERLTGEAHETFSNKHTERGKEMEAEALRAYAFQTDAEPMPVGFILNSTGSAGCSPDRLVSTDGMAEVKTKVPHLHLELLLDGKVPNEHMAQLQGQLWVTEREWVDFISYWPRLRLFIKRVFRDEGLIARIKVEVDTFNAEMSELLKRVS